LGDKDTNPYITTDFSESQLEFVSPVFDSIDKALKFIANLHKKTNKTLKTLNQKLHNHSMPPILCKDLNKIKTAKFKTNKNATKYRKYLLKKYGLKNQLVCGIHYNFSFDERLLKELFMQSEISQSYKGFKNELYLKVNRIISYNRWLFVYLNGCGYEMHKSFYEKKYSKVRKSIQPNKLKLNKKTNTYKLKNGLSFRNGVFGYQNNPYLYANFKSFAHYIKSIQNLAQNKSIMDLRELYHPVRLKTHKKSNNINSLKDGIEYIEIRFLDINPKYKSGVSKQQANFIHLFLIYALLCDNKDSKFNKKQQKEALQNTQNIAHNGKDKNVSLTYQGKKISKKAFANKILDDMVQAFKKHKIYNNKVALCIKFIKDKL